MCSFYITKITNVLFSLHSVLELTVFSKCELHFSESIQQQHTLERGVYKRLSQTVKDRRFPFQCLQSWSYRMAHSYRVGNVCTKTKEICAKLNTVPYLLLTRYYNLAFMHARTIY